MKRDRLYEIILAIVLISLGLGMGKFLTITWALWQSNHILDTRSIFALIANVVAVFGVLWLLTDYLRRLKEAKANEVKDNKELK